MGLDNLEASINSTQATVTHDPLPTVTVDGTQIMQVFQNLIGNALKFRGEAPPRIHVGAQRQEGRWVFSVRDNGIGIEPQYFDKIFQTLPAPAHAQAVCRDGHWAGHLQANRRAAWGDDLGRVPAWPGHDLLLLIPDPDLNIPNIQHPNIH